MTKELSKFMGRTVGVFAVLLITLLTLGCTKVEQKEPVRISINVWPGNAHAFIAQEKGFFKKNNVNVELLLRKNISESNELYRRGEVDGFFSVLTDIIMLNSDGIHTKVVHITDYSDSGDVIIGRPEITSLADLKDKKVSFEGINSFSHMFVLKALEGSGLKEYDVQFENLPAMDVLKALEERRIDAGHTWEPVTSQALKKGFNLLAKAGDFPGIIIDALAFRATVIKERPDDIRRIIKSILEARDFLYSNRDSALGIMSKAEGISTKELERGISGVHHLDLSENIEAMKGPIDSGTLYSSGKVIMDFYIKRGQLSKELDLSKIIEPTFLAQIKKDLE